MPASSAPLPFPSKCDRERETPLLLSFSIRVLEKFQTFFRDRDRERVFNLGSVLRPDMISIY